MGDRLKQASCDTFRDSADLAVAENLDALVLVGDVFDNDFPDLKSRAFLVTQLLCAGATRVPTVLIHGNQFALLGPLQAARTSGLCIPRGVAR